MPEHLISKVTMIIFENVELVASVQIVFAVFVLFAGIQFLKLHAWARTALEVVSWLGLVYVVGSFVLFVVSWMSMTSTASVVEGTHSPPAMFRVFGAFMVTVVMAVWAVPLVVIVKFLRGATIINAMTQK